MAILHIAPSYKPAYIYGGPTISVSRLCESQQNAGASVEVIATTANGQEELPVPLKEAVKVEGVTVYYFPRITGDHSHFSPSLLRWVFQNCKNYQVVHIHSWWNLVAILTVLVCWLRGVRPVLSPRGMLSSYSFEHENNRLKKLFHHTVGKFLLSKTILHATAKQEAGEGQQLISGWKFFIAPNIIELPVRASRPTGSRTEPLRLIFLSRIDPKKGLELTFAALAKLHFPWVLEIIGDGSPIYINHLKNVCKGLGIEKQLIWRGWASGEEKYEYLRQADLFLLTSQNENFANAVLESLAVGTAVLVSDQVGMSAYVEEENLGWVCPLDVERIAATLEEINQHRDRLAEIAACAPEKVYRDFDATTIAKKYIQAYQEFIK